MLPENVMHSSLNEVAMGRRALLTKRERELIADTEVKDARYVAISRIRTKIQDELPKDVVLLQENHPELYKELQKVVCEDEIVEK
jgi:hypothetical protein